MMQPPTKEQGAAVAAGVHEDFGHLLGLYMRRIRASASGVATEIGLSREAVNNWRNGVSLPNPRSRDRLAACAQYLRLTEAETNRLFSAAGFATEFPLQSAAAGAQPFAGFMDRLFAQLAQATPYAITMLLSPAHWGQPPFRNELLLRARAQYGAEAVLHIQPPYSVSTAPADYFAALGRQCGLGEVGSDYEFEALLEKRLLAGGRLFCLVSRFEQGTAQLRETLAGILRSLSEMHSGRLHLLLCGSEALADLKYRSGDLSLLNIGQVAHWPDPTQEDLALMARQRWPGTAWPAEVIEALQALTGGHPALFEEALQWLAEQGVSTAAVHSPLLRAHLVASARLWQTLLPLAQEAGTREQLRSLVDAASLGRARPYLQDAVLRRLFWGNLLQVRGTGEGACLHWRCDVARDAALAVLQA
jgi:transcriptional regulator with XRE-family HTH domain